MAGTPKSPEVDAYIAAFPPKTRAMLQQMRRAIRKAAPSAEECISYKIAAFRNDGQVLVYFAGWKAHVSLYPIPEGTPAFRKRVAPYVKGRGTLQFPLDQKLPTAIIENVVAEWLKAKAKAAAAKKKPA
jgi:uncharacterized protein YdhG (YjbR/CyaY superfamily)